MSEAPCALPASMSAWVLPDMHEVFETTVVVFNCDKLRTVSCSKRLFGQTSTTSRKDSNSFSPRSSATTEYMTKTSCGEGGCPIGFQWSICPIGIPGEKATWTRADNGVHAVRGASPHSQRTRQSVFFFRGVMRMASVNVIYDDLQ